VARNGQEENRKSIIGTGIEDDDITSKQFQISATKFGAMLDQLTDRCGTMGLLVTLSYFYPRYMFWFQISMSIDVACHWFYLHT